MPHARRQIDTVTDSPGRIRRAPPSFVSRSVKYDHARGKIRWSPSATVDIDASAIENGNHAIGFGSFTAPRFRW